MRPYLLLGLQTAVVVLGVVGLALWLRRRLAVRWSSWAWGALAFVGSQAVRLPLLTALTLLAQPYFKGIDAETAFWVNIAVLVPTSGLFEEAARYIVLRWAARNTRRWEDAVMFGAGHGGIEAILIFGANLINAVVLLSGGDALVAQLRAVAPAQADAVAAQITALRALQPTMLALGVWERVTAIAFHISASILVLLAVRERRLSLLWLAMLWHMLLNGVAVIVLHFYGALTTEVAVTLVALLALAIIVVTRRREPPLVAEPA